MITKWIVEAILSAIASLFTLIPDISIPDLGNPTTNLATVGQFGRIVPLGFLMICVAASLVLTAAIFIWDATFFVYHQVWGSD